MLLFIIIAFLIAGIKKYDVFCIFKTFDLYPLFFVESIYLFFQVSVFFDNYSYVQYASKIQMAFILVLLVPIVRRRLFGPALVGSGLVLIGSALNRIVMAANGGKMPVLPTLSKITRYYRNDALSQGIDGVHILMTGSTKLNVLADYIDTGFSIMSIGDLFIHAFITLIVYYTIRSVNQDTGKAGE